MKKLTIITMFLLYACGPHVEIEYHFNTPKEEIVQKNGEQQATMGYATWKKHPPNKIHCDIYLLPFDEYLNNECYQIVLAHEQKHCYEGNYHGNEITYPEKCTPKKIVQITPIN